MNRLYIGADLGTSGLKLILMSAEGQILKTLTESYPIAYPKPGWAEQNPEDWYQAMVRGVRKLTDGIEPESVKGIAIDGQMHGLVVLDESEEVIRPAILWNDGRSYAESLELNQKIGEDKLIAWTGNISYAGFTASKLIWLRKNEEANFKRIAKVMLPKDFLVYRLTGVHATDQSDAAGTLLLNVKQRSWSEEMLSLCHISKSQLPALYESYEIVGCLRAEQANRLGLTENCFLVAGASDNAAAAIGSGTIGDGRCNISLGTSGTVFVGSSVYRESRNPAIHNFAHADGNYHYLGCMLSAASAYDWWIKEILETDFSDHECEMRQLIGRNNVFFLPYLMGERSPHNDPLAKACFIGLNNKTKRTEMSLSVLEGITFGLRDSLEAIRQLGIPVPKATLVGGGAKNRIWRTIVADVLGIEIELLADEVGPSLGAAILAAYAGGEFSTLEEACSGIVRKIDKILPNPTAVERYERAYRFFRTLYPSLRERFTELERI